VRGCTIRAIGRDLKERSPEITVKNGWAASRPVTRRIAVPLLPASRTVSGSLKPSVP
jgi:hypothetical protein